MNEVNRYYQAFFVKQENGTTVRHSLTFRADNKGNAHDHATHVAYANNLGSVAHVAYLGRIEPPAFGELKRGAL